ncbi:MAG: dienelactone hydrolase family protein [Trueperaceae bacterium]|nr:dienelactone hydrolase family protein [Trueperaceae bacterium]
MRTLKRVLIGSLVAAVVAGVAVSIPIDRLVTGDAVARLANATLPGPDGPLHAYVALPDAAIAGPLPLVVMIHEFWGLDEATIGKAELLAEDGYVVVAPT